MVKSLKSFFCKKILFLQHHLLKLSFPHWMVLAPFLKISSPHRWGSAWLLYFISLYVCLMLILHCFDCHFAMENCESSKLVFLWSFCLSCIKYYILFNILFYHFSSEILIICMLDLYLTLLIIFFLVIFIFISCSFCDFNTFPECPSQLFQLNEKFKLQLWSFCNFIFIYKMILFLCHSVPIFSQLMFYQFCCFVLFCFGTLLVWISGWKWIFLIPKVLLKDVWFKLGILYFFLLWVFLKSLYQLKYFLIFNSFIYISAVLHPSYKIFFFTIWSLHYSLPLITLTMWVCILLLVLLELCFWEDGRAIQI